MQRGVSAVTATVLPWRRCQLRCSSGPHWHRHISRVTARRCPVTLTRARRFNAAPLSTRICVVIDRRHALTLQPRPRSRRRGPNTLRSTKQTRPPANCWLLPVLCGLWLPAASLAVRSCRCALAAGHTTTIAQVLRATTRASGCQVQRRFGRKRTRLAGKPLSLNCRCCDLGCDRQALWSGATLAVSLTDRWQ